MYGTAATVGPGVFNQDREDADRVIVIEAAGTPQESREMRRLLMEGVAGEPQHLFVDLRRVEHLSSQGFAALVGVRSRQVASRRRLTLVCDSGSSTEQVLARTGMRGRFTTVTELPGLCRGVGYTNRPASR
jgi:anti-anti-sigma regulatory factor